MAGNIVKVKDGSYRLRYRLLAAFITEIEKGDFSQPSKITFKEFA